MNIVALLAALLLLAGCSAPSDPRTAAPGKPPLEGAAIGGPFALVDGNNRPVTDRSFPGQWRIMYFGYTFCPDVCPTDAAAIGAGLKLAEQADAERAAKVTPVFVTVDPARDTPAVVGQFAANFHPRFVGLTGPQAAIDAIKKGYAVYSARGETSPGGGYLVDHSRQAYLMDPAGKPVAFVEQDKGPQAVADAIAKWVR